MQSASSVTLLNFLYITLKSKIFSIIHKQIHIIQEFGDRSFNVNALSKFFGLVIIYAYEN